MGKVVALGLNKFNLSELMEICTHVELIVQNGLSKSELPIMASYQDRLQTFSAAVKGKADILGAALVELDAKVDMAHEAIGLILKANVMHYDIRIAEIATEVQNVYLEVDNPTQLPYEQEYPAILRLLTLFETVPTKDLALAGIAGWVVELRQRYQAFMDKLNTQEQFKDTKQASMVKSSRLGLIAAYKELIEQLNALYILQPSSEHGALLDALNTYFESLRLQSKPKTKKSVKAKA